MSISTADVNLATGTQSGLIARFGDVNGYYAATVTKGNLRHHDPPDSSSSFGGVYTELAVAEGTAAVGKMRLRHRRLGLHSSSTPNYSPSAIDFSLASGGRRHANVR